MRSAREEESYYGIYQGTVVNGNDPTNGGRATALIPAVLGESVSGWCMPLFSGASPRIGEIIWVQFANGDLTRPLYLPAAGSGAGASVQFGLYSLPSITSNGTATVTVAFRSYPTTNQPLVTAAAQGVGAPNLGVSKIALTTSGSSYTGFTCVVTNTASGTTTGATLSWTATAG